MKQRQIDKISGAIGALILMVFVFGLSHSISKGFAGFWGGFPFMIITIVSIGLVVFDYWDTCLREKK
jgi:hypothetical protein